MSAAEKIVPMYAVKGSNASDVQENYQTGFISLFRSIRKHWIWADPVKFQWWCDILLEVNYAPKKVLIKGSVIECDRGQSVRSLGEWAKRWRTNISAVRRFFELLKSEQMIDTESVGKTTRLTVCKYESYQSLRNDNETIMKSKRKDYEKEMTTNNKDNNYNKERERGASAPTPPKTSFKNISDTDFREELKAYLPTYGKETLNAFYKYWSEKSASGKMRFQLQQTWETKKRIEAWARRDSIKPPEKQGHPTHTAPPLKTAAELQNAKA